MIRGARIALCLVVFAAAVGIRPAAAQTSPPDVIFVNGEIVTMEERLFATALAMTGDRIVAVGGEEVAALAGPDTLMIDLGGRTMIPGFVDAHTHLFNDAGFWGEDLAGMQALALRNGITTFADMYATPEFLEEMEAFAASGSLRVRTSLYLSRTTNCGDDLGEWYLDHPVQRDTDLRLRILGIKIFADGGTCGRPAISFPYADTGEHGDLFHSAEELAAMVAVGNANGYQVAIHAQGDLAIDQALDAIEAALGGEPNDLRHRIEHNAIIRDDQLPRYSEIGIVPTVFGTYFTCYGITDGNYARVFGEEHLGLLENWRRFIDANPDLIVAWHGDDPGVLPGKSDPRDVRSGHAKPIRDDTGEVCEAPTWLATFGVNAEQALRMMTINAAYALFMEDAVGSLAPGKFADLVILSDDPLTVPADEIHSISVLATYLGGRVEYCADDALCRLAP